MSRFRLILLFFIVCAGTCQLQAADSPQDTVKRIALDECSYLDHIIIAHQHGKDGEQVETEDLSKIETKPNCRSGKNFSYGGHVESSATNTLTAQNALLSPCGDCHVASISHSSFPAGACTKVYVTTYLWFSPSQQTYYTTSDSLLIYEPNCSVPEI